MRIIWINEYASTIGGCERYISNTAALLQERGFESLLLHAAENRAEPEFISSFDRVEPITDLSSQLKAYPHDLVYVHQCHTDKWIEELIDHDKPVIRFLHDYDLFSLSRHKMCPFSNQPCTHPLGCQCYPFPYWINRKGEGIELRSVNSLRFSQGLNKRLDGFVVASNYVKQEVIANGFDPKRVDVLPLYSFDWGKELRKKRRDPHLILFVGQQIRGKGLDTAIEALYCMDEKYHLAIAGKGRQEPVYRRMVSRLGLVERVQFLGQLSQDELAGWYQKAACLAFPTRYPELFGLVGPEAMSCSLPIVASRVGAVPEWLEEGKTGVLVPPNDFKSFSEAISEICSNIPEREGFSRRARENYLTHFQPKKHIDALVELFRCKIEEKSQFGSWGCLTMGSSKEAGQTIKRLLEEVKQKVTEQIPQEGCKALLLTGGYGKGEGGIEFDKDESRPHNNLDFIFITKRSSKKWRETFSNIMDEISEKYSIGIDWTIISSLKVNQLSHHLVWYEAQQGHRLILGDARYVAKLPFRSINQVMKRDFFELMANRGSLLIINQYLMDCGKGNEEEIWKVLIKHMMKAVIGYGDALLDDLGDYHWSYIEKQKRFLQHAKIPEEMKKWYKTASEFRFYPNYEIFREIDINSCFDKVYKIAKSIFFQWEKHQLGEVGEGCYIDLYLKQSLRSNLFSLNGWFRKVKGLLSPAKSLIGTSFISRMAFRLLSPRERFYVCFPVVLFSTQNVKVLQQVASFLGAKNASPSELRRAYLKQWCIYGDVNFPQSIKKWGLDL